MKIIADTNVLLRAVLEDHPVQSPVAQQTLENATSVSVSTVTMCEFVWVLGAGYKRSRVAIEKLLQAVLDMPALEIDRQAVDTGIEIMKSGGDFADGVVAWDGRRIGGGGVFVTFDKKASEVIGKKGWDARLLPSTNA